MGSSSFVRRAKLVSGKYERKYRTSDGQLRTEVLEDSVVKGVSTTVPTVSGELASEDISSQITTNKIAYSSTDDFSENSLVVYLNGLNVTKDVTVTGDGSFTLSNDYIGGILTSDNLFITYVKAS